MVMASNIFATSYLIIWIILLLSFINKYMIVVYVIKAHNWDLGM